MKYFEQLKEYLSDKVYNDFPQIQRSVENTKTLIYRIETGKIYTLLEDDDKARLESNLSKIINELKNFEATKNEDIHLQLDYFIFNNYSIVIERFESFENKFTDSISILNKQLSTLKEEVKNCSIETKKTNTALKSSLESCRKTDTELDQLRKDAIKRINDFATEIQNENQKKLEKITETVSHQKSQWLKRFEELDTKRKKFEKLYEEATTYFSETRFDKYSDEERLQANIFRKISIVLMLFVVFFIVSLTIYTVIWDNNAEWYDYITRSLLVFTLMIPAIYTSRESSRHRRNSDKYTQMANELKAFKITLEVDDLDVKIKNKVKEEIYKRYFGNLLYDETKDIGDSISDFYGRFGKKKE